MSPLKQAATRALSCSRLQAFMGELELLLAEAVSKAERLQAQLQKLGTPVAAHREAVQEAPHEDAPEEEDAPWSSPQARAAAVKTLRMTLVGKEAYMQAQQQELGAPPAARREALQDVLQDVPHKRAPEGAHILRSGAEKLTLPELRTRAANDQHGHVRMTCAWCYLGGKLWSWVL